jgi:YfiR/HmsC-like
MRQRAPDACRPPPGAGRAGRPARVLRALALLLACSGALAQGPSEHGVKAAFVYNFTKFVQWPEQAFATPQAPLVVCLPGRDALNGSLDALEGRPVLGREFRIQRSVRPEEVKGCHVLFIPEPPDARGRELFRAAQGQPVLTVGEADGFAEAGGAIGFIARDERVQFEINPEAAARANLRISSELLRLATIVRDKRWGRS